jgi:hypothetical protein
MTRSRAEEYRRLAQECLTGARTVTTRELALFSAPDVALVSPVWLNEFSRLTISVDLIVNGTIWALVFHGPTRRWWPYGQRDPAVSPRTNGRVISRLRPRITGRDCARQPWQVRRFAWR